MPDDAAPLVLIPAIEQPVNGLLDRAELLMASDDFDGLPFVARSEERKGADKTQEVVFGEHSGDKALLLIRS